MGRKPTRQLTLDQLTTFGGLPSSEAYGADHAPTFPIEEVNRLYTEATSLLTDPAEAPDCLQAMALLALLESASALDEPPQAVSIAAVELAQALVLQRKAEGLALDRPRARAFVEALSTHFHLFLDQTAKPPTDDAGRVLSRRRTETLMIRHTFYPHHAERIFRRIGAHLERVGTDKLGVPLGRAALLAMAVGLFAATMLKGSDAPAKARKWLESGDGAFDSSWVGLFEIPLVLITSAEPQLTPVQAAQLLDRMSLAPGDLAASDPAHLHLHNPVWRRPFVKAGGKWFCFSPGTVLSSHADLLSNLASGISGKPGELLGKARGDALEKMLVETLEAMFPHGQVLNSALWDDPESGRTYETDAILLVDGIVIIFEAKGDALAPASRRGSREWLRDFDDIAVKACLQAWRLERLLRDTSVPTLEFKTASGTVTLTKADVRHVLRFGVSLERVTMASFGLEGTLRERIEHAGGRPMPILTIGDLWQVRDLVGSEGRCLHYLLRRFDLERDYQFVGDELDLLAHYLRTGFVRLYDDDAKQGAVVLYGLSDFLRHYQAGTPHHVPGLRQPQRTTALWDRWIAEEERRARSGWTDIVHDLLNIPLAAQRRFEDDIRRMRRTVRRQSGKGISNGVLMQAPAQLRPSALACVVMRKVAPADRSATMRHYTKRLEANHPNERLGIFRLDADATDLTPVLAYYRTVYWDADIPSIEAEGEHVGTGLYVDLSPVDAEPTIVRT